MQYKNNIWKTGFIMGASQEYIIFGIYVIYMVFMGLSITQITTILSARLILSSVGQIPGGIFADKYGYKTSILIGLFISAIGMAIFAFANSFIFFLIGYSVAGFGYSMISGADQAMIYESLLKKRKGKTFKKVIGKIYLYMNISAIILCSLGGFLYSYFSPRVPLLVQLGITISAFIVALFLKPAPIQGKKIKVIKYIVGSLKYAFTKKDFSKIFIFSAIIGSISMTTNQFLQPFYKSINIDESYFGMIASLAFLFWGLGSYYSDKLGKLFSIDHYLVLHASVFSLFLLILHKVSNIPIVIIIISVLFFLRGIYAPTISTYINDKVPSEKRATMLSINSQFLYIFCSLSLFGIGYIAETQSLSMAFFGISILSMLFLITYILSLRKVRVE